MLNGLLVGIFSKFPSLPSSIMAKEVGSSLIQHSAIPATINIFGNSTTIRTKVRYYFPNPNEKKRVTTQGFRKRMSTLGGRKILMRRILRGRHVLSH